MKILLYCPTYMKNGKMALDDRTKYSIEALIVPDSVTMDIEIDTVNPIPLTGKARQDHENTLIKYRKARQKVLNENYDALLTIEHDMIVPADALVKMLETDADVVYGLYLFRHVKPVLNCLRAVKADWADMSVSFFPELIEKGFRDGCLECSGAGYGCTLIHRRVLEILDFRRAEDGHPSSDMPFATDCLRHNFKQICRFDIPCGHIKADKTVLWPHGEGGTKMSDMVKIYVYQSFNADINGQNKHFKEGTEAEMPEDSAHEFVRAGFVGYVVKKPATKVVPPAKKTTTTKKAAVK